MAIKPQSASTSGPRELKSPPSVVTAIVVVTLIMFILLALIAQRIKHQGRADIEGELSSMLKITQRSLSLWKETVKTDQALIAELAIVHSLVEGKLSESSDHALHKVLNPWIKSGRYRGYAIFKKDVLGQPDLILKHAFGERDLSGKSQDVIKKALHGEFSMGPPQILSSEEVVAITAFPINDITGKTIGALCFVVDLLTRFMPATQLGRMGESGETYAVNEYGQLITPSRFKGEFAIGKTYSLKHPLFTQEHTSFSGHEVNFNLDGYRDYRDITVIGAWTWDKEIGIGLIAEIDKTEAYRSYDSFKNLAWLMSIIVVIGMGFLLLYREIGGRDKLNKLKLMGEARKELLSVVSHDLKNPLNTLMITTDILIKTLPPEDEAFSKRRKLLQKNYQAAEQMQKLISNLLDSATIEAGKLEINPVECDGVLIIDQSLELIEPPATQKHITLVQDIPADLPHVAADPERLSQIFSNLLGNAVKYTPDGGCITAMARAVDDQVQFSIKNTGLGIAKENQPYLFDRYWQAKDSKGRGSGLGLAICRDLVTAHGGNIWVESEPGEGSVFHFTIPVFVS